MKKVLLYISAVILLCGVTASCAKEDDDNNVSTVSDETIIMFFPYSGLAEYIRDDISEMKLAISDRGGLGNTRIVVCNSASVNNSDIYEMKYVSGRWQNDTIAKNVSTFYPSESQDEVATKIQNVLETVKSNVPSKGYSMIIGCHGSGWLPSGTALGDCNNAYPTSSAKRKAFGTASDLAQIDNATLAKALNAVGIHLNYILFDACYMATVEGIYDLRSVTDYVIASQNEIMGVGIPYRKVGDDLIKHNYEEVVNKYYIYYNEEYSYNLGSLSVIDCSKFDAIAPIVKEINNSSLKADLDLSSVQRMDSIQPTVFYDFGDYFDKACNNISLSENLKTRLNDLVPYKKSTKYVFTAYPKTYYGYTNGAFQIKTYSGISTSQPTINAVASKCIQKTSWWSATH